MTPYLERACNILKSGRLIPCGLIPRRFRSDVVRVVLTARGEELMPSGSGGGCGSWLSETSALIQLLEPYYMFCSVTVQSPTLHFTHGLG